MDINTLEEKLGIANLSDTEKLALVRGIESNVQASKAAVKAQEAGQYASLVVDAIKKIKSDLEARFNELNGIIDVKAKVLKDGKDGIDGKDGKNGVDGKDGKDGLSITGPKGADGEDGKDGVGVQDAHIDFDGSLIITLTNGKELNVGEVVPFDVAEKIKVIGNGGGTSQSVLDSIAALTTAITTNVAITGGTIDNTVIGGTTPAAGTFTTLTATGQTSLGGAVGAEGLRVTPLASSTTYINARAGVNGGNAQFGLNGTGNTDFIQYTLGTGAFRFLTNGIGVDQFRISHTASAVNYVQVTGGATSGSVVISAQGSDTNVGLRISSKGAFNTSFWSNNNTNQQFAINGAAAAVNRLEVAGSVAGSAPSMSSVGSDTNIPLVLQPKGTGALQAQQTDSTATGGNARGANAVDWQMARTGSASQVASGANSFVGGGRGNTASGQDNVVVGGYQNTAASGAQGAIVCGANNSVSAPQTFIGAGVSNSVTRDYSAIVMGSSNTAAGYYNFIGGGATNSATANAAVTTQSATMNGTTTVTLSGSNANIKVGQLITGTYTTFPTTYVAAISGTTLTLSQAATGSGTATLSFYTPHGVVVGGGNNQATGSYSFIGGGGDAGTAGNRNVASGDYSAVVGGISNQATGIASFVGGGGRYGSGVGGNSASGLSSVVVGGLSNQATGGYSFLGGGNSNLANSTGSFVGGGYYGTTRGIVGFHSFPACAAPVQSLAGASQGGLLVLGKQTTDATATVITSDGGAASGTNQVILPNNSAYYFKGTVVAGVTGGGNTKGWTVEGVIKRGANAASTTVVGVTVASMYADAGAVTWTIGATADTTNGGLAITFTGQAATTIRCVAKIETTECTY